MESDLGGMGGNMVALPIRTQVLRTGVAGLCLTLLSTTALAQQASPQAAPVSVEQLFDLIQVQRAQIEAQQRRIEQLEYAIRGITGAGQPGTNFSQADYSGQPGQVAQQGQTQGQQPPQNQPNTQPQGTPQQPVGEEDPDAQRRRIDVSGVQDIG